MKHAHQELLAHSRHKSHMSQAWLLPQSARQLRWWLTPGDVGTAMESHSARTVKEDFHSQTTLLLNKIFFPITKRNACSPSVFQISNDWHHSKEASWSRRTDSKLKRKRALKAGHLGRRQHAEEPASQGLGTPGGTGTLLQAAPAPWTAAPAPRTAAAWAAPGSQGTLKVRLHLSSISVTSTMHVLVSLRLFWIRYCGLRIMGSNEHSIYYMPAEPYKRVFVGIRKILEHFSTR